MRDKKIRVIVDEETCALRHEVRSLRDKLVDSDVLRSRVDCWGNTISVSTNIISLIQDKQFRIEKRQNAILAHLGLKAEYVRTDTEGEKLRLVKKGAK